MTVSYIRVQTLSDIFAPAVRAFGNVAVVGPGDDRLRDVPDINTPVPLTNPSDALATFGGTLGESIKTAFLQTPGPSLVYGIRTDATPDWGAALRAAELLDVQFVVLANCPVGTVAEARRNDPRRAAPDPVLALVDHVVGTSTNGEDGRERMGVAMLASGVTDPRVITSDLAQERMVFVAHKAEGDVAAAVAGTIAGYEPHVSVLLKQVNIKNEPFTAAEIETINGTTETSDSGPTGAGVVWLTDPVLIPGRGAYLGEAYTGNPGGRAKKYIDLVRTVDDVSFRLKARLIGAIGNLRISRSGLRSLTAQMEAVLDPLVRREVIDRYRITIPVLTLLDKDPLQLTPSEDNQLRDARARRIVEVLTDITYAGAIHRLSLSLKFT